MYVPHKHLSTVSAYGSFGCFYLVSTFSNRSNLRWRGRRSHSGNLARSFSRRSSTDANVAERLVARPRTLSLSRTLTGLAQPLPAAWVNRRGWCRAVLPCKDEGTPVKGVTDGRTVNATTKHCPSLELEMGGTPNIALCLCCQPVAVSIPYYPTRVKTLKNMIIRVSMLNKEADPYRVKSCS